MEKGKKMAVEAEVMRLAEEEKSEMKSHVVDESSLKGRFSDHVPGQEEVREQCPLPRRYSTVL